MTLTPIFPNNQQRGDRILGRYQNPMYRNAANSYNQSLWLSDWELQQGLKQNFP